MDADLAGHIAAHDRRQRYNDALVGADLDAAKLGTGAAFEILAKIADTAITAQQKKEDAAKKKADDAKKKDEPKKPDHGGHSSGGNFFTKRLGPLPVYGWLGIGAGAVGLLTLVLMMRRKRR